MSASTFGLFCAISFAILVNYSHQVSISIDTNSYKPLNQTKNYWKSLSECFKIPSNRFSHCVYKSSIQTLDTVIDSNETWHFTDYIALKKNFNWQPTRLEARELQSPIDFVITKLSDLLTSRSLQFTWPNDHKSDRKGRYSLGGAVADSVGVGKQVYFTKNQCQTIKN